MAKINKLIAYNQIVAIRKNIFAYNSQNNDTKHSAEI